MTRRLQSALFILPLLFAAPSLRAGEVLDGIVASVNHHAILQSELQEAVRFEAFVNQSPWPSVAGEAERATLERLIDQILLQQQMRAAGFSPATKAEVAKKLVELRAEILRARGALPNSGSRWQALLAQYGLSEQEVSAHLALQLDCLRFIEQRFRPTIHIDAANVQRYYTETLLPELRRSGALEAPLPQLSEKIHELLVQQSINGLLAKWMQTLRRQGAIEVR